MVAGYDYAFFAQMPEHLWHLGTGDVDKEGHFLLGQRYFLCLFVVWSIAELGVYKGDIAWKLNALFPERPLHLFDTFQGFDARDISRESSRGLSRAQEGVFSDTSISCVLERLPHPEQALIHKGFFPDTAAGLKDCRFALVSLDADLFAPYWQGLSTFILAQIPVA